MRERNFHSTEERREESTERRIVSREKSGSLRAERVARLVRAGRKLPYRSSVLATNKVVRGGTIRLKHYYTRDTKVRHRLRDFMETAPHR
jgi:hypothetical protein